MTRALTAIERGNDLALPDTMPALPYNDGYRTPVPDGGPPSPAGEPTGNVGALLARVLLAATLAAEDGAEVPVASMVFLGVLGPEPTKVKDMGAAAAVRKEAVGPAIKHLARWGQVATAGTGAAMTAALTSEGGAARDAHRARMAAVEDDWRTRHGAPVVDDLRAVLSSLYQPGPSGRPPLADGLEPPEKGWRASKPYRAQTDQMLTDPAAGLPVHPLLTHRGAWPDGA